VAQDAQKGLMMDNPKNIALLIDADNASPDGFDDVLAILAELGTVNIRRAYANWEKPLKGWKGLMHRYAIEPQQQFDVTKGKSATDMRMIIDAMDLLASGRVDGFGLMSSDSDFMPLAMRLRQDGTPVYGFGTAKTPESFRQSCTRFIFTDALGDAEPTISVPQIPNPQGVNDELLAALGAAWKAEKRDERGWARLADVGRRLNAGSSLDLRSMGYSRMSDLIAKIPQFSIEKREDGAWIKRVR
jgi:NYN domain/OST-HTH/LOTUS domain